MQSKRNLQSKRSLSILALVILMTAGFALLAFTTGGVASTTITVWFWGDQLKAAIAGFEQKHPDITVNFQKLGWDDTHKKLIVALASGQGAPDVVAIDERFLAQYTDKGLWDLTDRVKKYKADFVPYKWADAVRNGRYYAVPWDAAPVGVFYRRDVFKEAGVDPESIDTWDDYLAAGKKIANASEGKVKMLAFQKTGAADLHQILTWQQGSGMFDASGKVAVDDTANLKSLRLLSQMLKLGIVADMGGWTPVWFNAMKEGTVATFINGAWFSSTINESAPDTAGKWGVMRMPAWTKGGVRASNEGGSYLAIPAQSKNKEAAWKFIEYALCTPEGQKSMYTPPYYIFPALQTVYNDTFFDEPLPFFADQPIRRLFVKIVKEVPTYYYTSDYKEALTVLGDALFQTLDGAKRPEIALKEAAQNIRIKTGRK